MQPASVGRARHRASGVARLRRRWAMLAAVMLAGLMVVPAIEAAAAATKASKTALSMSSPYQSYGSPIKARVAATVNGKPVPGAIRYFFDGHLAAQVSADANGKAVWQLQGSIPVGTHRLQVYFLPTGGGISTSATQTTVVVSKATPLMGVAIPKSKPPFGSSTTISMSVSAAHLGAATGTVSLSENGRMIAIRQLVHGATRVNFKLTSTPGNNVFTVRYSGSAAIAAGSRAVQFPTSRAAPRVRITAANASTVQVSVGGGPRAASGTVVAVMDGHPAGSARLSASGTAAVALHNVSTGNHSVRISYQGDPRYLGSSSGTITVHKTPAVTVNPCPPSARACVDLTHNRTWLQSNGHITYGPVPMQSGRPGYRTETGTFSVYWKDINHHSSIFDDAPMPYAIFFDGGTAFHQGSLYVESHGCVHLSSASARYYWSALDYGDVVQVFGYAPY